MTFVVICILEKSIQENTEKRGPFFSNKSCILSEGIDLTLRDIRVYIKTFLCLFYLTGKDAVHTRNPE